jgi:hypothetical protein
MRALLAQGADANHVRQLQVLHEGRAWRAFTAAGQPLPEEDPQHCQPTTPLKLVGFRISDCCLSQQQLWSFKEAAELLLQAGAQAGPALAHMEGRYGPCSAEEDPRGEPDAFSAVFQLVHTAAQRQRQHAALSR